MMEVVESAVAGVRPKFRGREEEPKILREEEARSCVTGVKGLRNDVVAAFLELPAAELVVVLVKLVLSDEFMFSTGVGRIRRS